MVCRLAVLTLLGALCACEAPPQGKGPAQPAVLEYAVAALPSKQQVDERSEQCGKMSREQFRRAWKGGTEKSAEGQMTADFAHHYNAKMNTCFYLLTVASTGAIKKMLFDIDGGELYGEFLGPASVESPAGSFPKTCRVEGLYCASAREWEVLVRPYFED